MEETFKYVLLINLIMLSILILDIPFGRQFIGFIYFSFLPGFLILKILSFDFDNLSDTILLSVGLSIGFLMLIGLLINELYPIFGIYEPLSFIPIYVTIFTVLSLMS